MINSIEYHTSEFLRFADRHLQPAVKEIPSYIKDINHFIDKVNNFSVPVNSTLVTMDVRSRVYQTTKYSCKQEKVDKIDLSLKHVVFLHCIDDIFIVWTKSEKQLKDFINELDQKHLSIKFD